jgi:hypothetical protein
MAPTTLVAVGAPVVGLGARSEHVVADAEHVQQVMWSCNRGLTSIGTKSRAKQGAVSGMDLAVVSVRVTCGFVLTGRPVPGATA